MPRKIDPARIELLKRIYAAKGEGIKVDQEVFGLERAGWIMRDTSHNKLRWVLTFSGCAVAGVKFKATKFK